MQLKNWHYQVKELHFNQHLSGRAIAKILNKSKSQVNDVIKFFKEANSIKPTVIVLDIETTPLMLGGWGLFNQNFSVNQIHDDWQILSVSYKELYSDEVFYFDIKEMSELEILTKLWNLLNNADFVIAHNGRRFDMKKIRSRMIMNGLPPYSPVRIIDTLEIAKREFGFTSNKLQYLTSILCTKFKKSTHEKFSGYDLWSECLKGNPEAFEEMRKYNILDVQSLEELYLILKPWDSKSPNFDLYEDEVVDMTIWEKSGFTYSNLGKYQRWRNINTGQFMRGRTNLLTKEKRKQLLSNII